MEPPVLLLEVMVTRSPLGRIPVAAEVVQNLPVGQVGPAGFGHEAVDREEPLVDPHWPRSQVRCAPVHSQEGRGLPGQRIGEAPGPGVRSAWSRSVIGPPRGRAPGGAAPVGPAAPGSRFRSVGSSSGSRRRWTKGGLPQVGQARFPGGDVAGAVVAPRPTVEDAMRRGTSVLQPASGVRPCVAHQSLSSTSD